MSLFLAVRGSVFSVGTVQYKNVIWVAGGISIIVHLFCFFGVGRAKRWVWMDWLNDES